MLPGEIVSAGVVVKAMILNGLGMFSRPLYLFPNFFQDKATEHLLGLGILPEHFPHFSPQRRSVKPKILLHQGLNLMFAQSRNTTVCGESSCLHQNQLNWAQKAIYLA